ncbi:MAG: hypothetical protein H0T41_11310 [Rhodobacteraceae bacterium]|nr:hypothetical protein [Paracoccaceae bacterium]
MTALAPVSRTPGGLRLACAAAAVALALAGARSASPALMELWLLVFVLLAGLSVGALGFLMIGHLLGEIWLYPVRDELEPMARAMPLIAILGAPLLFGLDQLYPWSRDASSGLSGPAADFFDDRGFVARNAAYVTIWTGLAVIMTRPGRHRRRSAVGLLLLAPSVGLASIDWIASRDPQWVSSLYGFSFAAAQALAALGLAVLLTLLRQGHPPAARLRSLQSVLLSLALLTLWIWFSQFLIVWMADLPRETSWYFARLGGGWTLLQAGVAAPALVAAIVLFIPPRPGRTRIVAFSALILVQHLAHTIWLIRPRHLAGAHPWPDVVLPACVVAVWAMFLAVEFSRQPPLDPEFPANG